MNTEQLIEFHIQSLDAYNKGRRSLSREQIGEALFHFMRALELFPDAMLVEPQLDRQTRLSMQQLKANILSHIELVKETYPNVREQSPDGWQAPAPPPAPEPEPVAQSLPPQEEEPLPLTPPQAQTVADLLEEPDTLLDAITEEPPGEDISHLLDEEEPPPAGLPVPDEFPELVEEPVLELPQPPAEIFEPEPPSLPEPPMDMQTGEPPALEIPLPEPPPVQLGEEDSLDALLDTIGPPPTPEEEPPAISPPAPEPEPIPIMEPAPAPPPEPAPAPAPVEPPAPQRSEAPELMPSVDHLLSDLDPPQVSTPPAPEPLAAPAEESLPPLPPPPPAPAITPEAKRKRKQARRQANPRRWQWPAALVLCALTAAMAWSNWSLLTFKQTLEAFDTADTPEKKWEAINQLYAKAQHFETQNLPLKLIAPQKHRQMVVDTFIGLDGRAMIHANENPRVATEYMKRVDGRYWDEGNLENFLNELLDASRQKNAVISDAQKLLATKLLTLHCEHLKELCEAVGPVVGFGASTPGEHTPPPPPPQKQEEKKPPVSHVGEKEKPDTGEKQKTAAHPSPKAHEKPAQPPAPPKKVTPPPPPRQVATSPPPPPKTHTLLNFPSVTQNVRVSLARAGLTPKTLDLAKGGEKLAMSYASAYAGNPKLKPQLDAEFLRAMDAVITGMGAEGSKKLYEVHFRVLTPQGKPFKTYKVLYQPYRLWATTGKRTGGLTPNVITVVK